MRYRAFLDVRAYSTPRFTGWVRVPGRTFLYRFTSAFSQAGGHEHSITGKSSRSNAIFTTARKSSGVCFTLWLSRRM